MKKLYNVQIEEVLQEVHKIFAKNKEEAIEIVRQLYKDGEIILSPESIKETNFSLYDDALEKENKTKGYER